MTKEQTYTRELWSKTVKLSEYGWIVYIYQSPVDLQDHNSTCLDLYVFPSVLAAKRFMDEVHPDIFFYEIVMHKVEPYDEQCPVKYRNLI